jgi:hypothetical protein
MAHPIYYDLDGNSICRRRDGNPQLLPDEILWPSGWRRLFARAVVSSDRYAERTTTNRSPHPAMWKIMTRIEEPDAHLLAFRLGLPTAGWSTLSDIPARRSGNRDPGENPNSGSPPATSGHGASKKTLLFRAPGRRKSFDRNGEGHTETNRPALGARHRKPVEEQLLRDPATSSDDGVDEE